MAISRTDRYGLLVRVKRNGKLYARYFSFSAHGGKQATWSAARRHQGKLLEIPRVPPTAPTLRNRTTGLRGISLSGYRNRAKGTKVYEYKVNYTSPATGKRRVKSFYIATAATFSKGRAAEVLRQAVRFRAAWQREQQKHVRRQRRA
jgi:hypothetical protein